MKVVGMVPKFFVVIAICIQKTMNTKIKTTCGVFSTKGTSGTATIEFGKFFTNPKHNHPKRFAEIEKTKIQARKNSESQKWIFAPRDFS